MKQPARQKGIALLMLIIIIVLAIASYMMSGLSLTEIKADHELKTLQALSKAKQALIEYAIAEADIDANRSGKFGFLPCPDVGTGFGEGVQGGNCGATNVGVIGWLPWRTLNLPYLTDDSGSCLLYAVSGDYKQSPETGMLNEDTNGQFQVVDDTATPIIGILPEDRIVAIVFAPGSVVSDQNRTFAVNSKCGQDYLNIQGYLEGDGVTDNGVLSGAADTIEQFIHAKVNSENAATPYNDRFVTITRDEIWAAILKRNDFVNKMTNLTEALALCLSEYNNDGGNNRMPWPAPLALADYRTNSNYDDVAIPIYAGRVPFMVDSSNTVTTEAVANLFASTGCNNLVLSIGGVVANLNNANDEYRQLWENWKDHFYYALSSDFEPAAAAASDCAGNCITVGVGAVEVAGIVFFSGSRLGVTRSAPPIDVDDKAVVSNYIENGNDAIFAVAAGDNTDAYSTNTSNDIMFCISGVLPFTVGAC